MLVRVISDIPIHSTLPSRLKQESEFLCVFLLSPSPSCYHPLVAGREGGRRQRGPQVHVLYIEYVVLNHLLNQFFLFFAVFPQLYFHMIHQRRKILSHTEEHKKFE